MKQKTKTQSKITVLLVATLLALSITIGLLATQSVTKQTYANTNAPLVSYNLHTMQVPNTNINWLDNAIHTYKLNYFGVVNNSTGTNFRLQVSGGSTNGEGTHIQILRFFGHLTDWNVVANRMIMGSYIDESREVSTGDYPVFYMPIEEVRGAWTYLFLFYELENFELDFPHFAPRFIYNKLVHITFGDIIPLPSEPVPPVGHIFLDWHFFCEWYIQTLFMGQIIDTNIELFPLFVSLIYSITFSLNNGNFSHLSPHHIPTLFTVDDLNIVLPSPRKDGFTFKGWYTNAGFSGSPVTNIPAGSIGNRVFYARWEVTPPTLYTVRFYSGSNLHYELQVPPNATLVSST